MSPPNKSARHVRSGRRHDVHGGRRACTDRSARSFGAEPVRAAFRGARRPSAAIPKARRDHHRIVRRRSDRLRRHQRTRKAKVEGECAKACRRGGAEPSARRYVRPDRTVAPVFQRQESVAAVRRRAINTAAAPLDASGAIAPRPIRRRIVEDDPFGPVGFYRGTFLVKPALELSGGYNSNPGQRRTAKARLSKR